MDNMLEHPGNELQVLIKEKGLTQKAFASILGKKVSELNELLKGKRNITIQRDYLLHQTIGTPIKYWILKQVDYDYSLLDIEENSNSPLLIGEGQGEVSQHHDVILSNSEESFSPLDKEGLGEIGSHSEALSEESRKDGTLTENNLSEIESQMDSSTSLRSSLNDNTTQTSHSEQSEESYSASRHSERSEESSKTGSQVDSSSLHSSEGQTNTQETPIQEPEVKDNKDLQNRAKIFRSF